MPAPDDQADLRTTPGWFPEPRDFVRVAGPDAISYVQGQLSQDVEALTVGASARSFVLQPAGKVDAWVRVTRTADDEVVLDLDGGFGEAVVARLRRFLLRTKADVDALDWSCIAVRGPGASGVAAPDDTLTVDAGWPGVEGIDLLGPSVPPPADLPEVGADDYERLRIRSGVPRMGAELTDRTIPAEAGRWAIDTSVSFTKGCFTGQELVARIDSRGGNVPRQLRGLVLPGADAPPADAAVVVDGDEVGTVTSVARTVALAYIGRRITPPAAGEVRFGDRAVPATVVDLPMG